MKMCGYGFPGQGFYSIKIHGTPKQTTNEFQGLVKVEKLGMSASKMEDELKYLIDEKWNWKVKKVAEKEFLAAFPNKQILDMFSKSAGFAMSLYNTWATVAPSTRDPASSSALQIGWLQFFNVPDRARSVEVVSLIGELAGEVVIVDELSLIMEDPVRVKLQARDIDKLRGIVEVFVEGVGYDIKFVPEKTARVQIKGSSPPPPMQDDEGSDEDEDKDLLGSDEEKMRGRNSRQGRGKVQESKTTGGGYSRRQSSISQNITLEPLKSLALGADTEGGQPIPIEAFDPRSGLVEDITKMVDNVEEGLDWATSNTKKSYYREGEKGEEDNSSQSEIQVDSEVGQKEEEGPVKDTKNTQLEEGEMESLVSKGRLEKTEEGMVASNTKTVEVVEETFASRESMEVEDLGGLSDKEVEEQELEINERGVG